MVRRPIVIMAVFAMAGVYTFSGLVGNWGIIIFSALALLTSALLFVTMKAGMGVTVAWVVAFFVFGGITHYQHSVYMRDGEILADGRVAIVGRVLDVDEWIDVSYEDRRRLVVQVSAVGGEAADFRIWLHTDDLETEFRYGDEIYAITNLVQAEVRRHSRDLQRAFVNLARGKRAVGGATYLEVTGNSVRFWDAGRMAFNVRRYIKGTVGRLFAADEAAIARGMMIGDKTGITDEMHKAIRGSGISHLVVVSGLHVSILVMAFMMMFKGFAVNRVMLKILAAAFMVVFFVTVGYAPSVTRAVVMAMIAMFAGAFWRRGDIFTTIALALMAVLAFRPYSMFEPGFQLSFACVLGIALFARPLEKMGGGAIWKKFVILLIISVATTVITAFATARFFYTVNLTAIWTNIVAIPIAQLALIGSYAIVILSVISETLAGILVPAVRVLLRMMVIVAEFGARHTYVSMDARPMTFTGTALYGAILYVIYAVEKEAVKWLGER